jgi:hypothetical protein
MANEHGHDRPGRDVHLTRDHQFLKTGCGKDHKHGNKADREQLERELRLEKLSALDAAGRRNETALVAIGNADIDDQHAKSQGGHQEDVRAVYGWPG